ncbi:hypothetical protein BD413DRAFT_522142 [Trametes elegans]|nr:hypothetical protein BD413DRAFT_522142 [Trametes elegans]
MIDEGIAVCNLPRRFVIAHDSQIPAQRSALGPPKFTKTPPVFRNSRRLADGYEQLRTESTACRTAGGPRRPGWMELRSRIGVVMSRLHPRGRSSDTVSAAPHRPFCGGERRERGFPIVGQEELARLARSHYVRARARSPLGLRLENWWPL